MAQHGIRPKNNLLNTDGEFHRADDPDFRYVAHHENDQLICAFGSWKGGWKTLGSYKGYSGDRTLTQEQKAQLDKEHAKYLERVQKRQEERLKNEIERQTKAWSGLQNTPICNEHSAYLKRKGVKPHGIKYGYANFKFTDENGTERVESDCPTIVIPIRNAHDEIQGLQHIRADGKKRIYGVKSGGFFLIGDPIQSKTIALCEGFATGATIFDATQEQDACVAVCFDCGNLRHAGEALAEKFSDHALLILGDDDEKADGSNPGKKHAEEAARALECRYAIPKFSEATLNKDETSRPSDFNDLAALEGMEIVREQLYAILEQKKGQEQQSSVENNVEEALKKAETEEDVVRAFNNRFSILEYPFGVLEYTDEAFQIQKKRDFIDRFQPLKIAGEKDKKISKTDIWLNSTERRTFFKLEFRPDQPADEYSDDRGRRYLNLWKGFAVEPKKGDCGLIKQHMFDVICGGKQKSFDYLWKLESQWVQHPEKRTVAIVLRSDHGAGKGRHVDLFAAIFGHAFLETSETEHVFGKFNAAIANKALVHLDDAIFGGDKRLMGKLKTFITGDRINIEYKGRDVISVHNPRKLIISSNEEYAIPIEPTERRYLFLDVSNHRIGDREYFASLTREMEGGGIEAFLYELLQTDITGFNALALPESQDYGFDNKIQSASSSMQFIHHTLTEGKLNGQPWGDALLCETFISNYQAFCASQKFPRPDNERVLGRNLTKTLRRRPAKQGENNSYISEPAFEKVKRGSGSREYEYRFPPLDQCRERFAAHFGYSVTSVFSD